MNNSITDTETKIKVIAKYEGHSMKANGNVDLNFKAGYGEITQSIQTLQMLNADVTLVAKLPGDKPIKLGSFRVKNVMFDGDGESKLRFNSQTDYVELDNLNALIGAEEFQLLLKAVLEMEINDEEEDD